MGQTMVVVPMRVRFADGSAKLVCCGLAALRELCGGAVAYEAVGDTRVGRCCHPRDERAERDENVLQMWFAARPVVQH